MSSGQAGSSGVGDPSSPSGGVGGVGGGSRGANTGAGRGINPGKRGITSTSNVGVNSINELSGLLGVNPTFSSATSVANNSIGEAVLNTVKDLVGIPNKTEDIPGAIVGKLASLVTGLPLGGIISEGISGLLGHVNPDKPTSSTGLGLGTRPSKAGNMAQNAKAATAKRGRPTDNIIKPVSDRAGPLSALQKEQDGIFNSILDNILASQVAKVDTTSLQSVLNRKR